MAKQVIQFNVTAFLNALGKELKKMNQTIRDELWDAIKDNMRDLPFKKNPVRLSGGRETSDWERRIALFNSMVDSRANWITTTHLQSTIKAMAKDFKQSHIGLYYEYGTGEKQDLSGFKYESLGDPNLPFRVPNTGARIVTRSSRLGMGGAWRDAGGNLRVTDSPRAGEPVRSDGAKAARFRAYIGEDVEAAHWFRNAVENKYLNNRFKSLWVTAIKAVWSKNKIESFLILKDFTIGKD